MFTVHNVLKVSLGDEIAAYNLFWNPPAGPAPIDPRFAAALLLLGAPGNGAGRGGAGGGGAGAANQQAPPPFLSSHQAALYQKFWDSRFLFSPECFTALCYTTGAALHQAATLDVEGIRSKVDSIFRNEGNFSNERFDTPTNSTLIGFQHYEFKNHSSRDIFNVTRH